MISLNERLEASRLELLDMGLRSNTLLSFRSGSKSIEIVDELSQEVYRIMVSEQKKMSYLPAQEPATQIDRTTSGLLEPDGVNAISEIAERHSDLFLQTELSREQLDQRLLKIRTEAETYFQEQGVDILYLALGILTWYEDSNSSIERRAPLMLIPVSLERGTAKESFK